jgi:hypothetical protein
VRAAGGEPELAVLEAAWVQRHGYTAPSPVKYPYQWLWDSCFHAIAWSGFGDPRALREMESLFALQLPNGFMPNMGYQLHPNHALAMWRSRGHSNITQPPMYGHALRVLHQRGYDVAHLTAPATRAINHLMDSRLDGATGLLRIVHPWETGIDDSPRFDSWMPRGFSRPAWNVRKYVMARRLQVVGGEGVANPMFSVCSVGFTALTAFNARELAALTGDTVLAARADALVAALERTWDPALRSWTDRLPGGGTAPSGRARTIDGLLPLLVVGDRVQLDAGFAALTDPREFWRPHGPSTVSAAEPSYQPATYWRGDSWPQMTYLLLTAAARQGRPVETAMLRTALRRNTLESGFSERSNSETGAALGATPQSWAAVGHEAGCGRAHRGIT